MGTDIYGFVEVRHPFADEDWYEWEPWVCLMPIAPLYLNDDDDAFACLFGVRNWLRWEPVAAERGLPADVSSAVRGSYEKDRQLDSAVHGASWVSWAELRDLDMSVVPLARGLLRVEDPPLLRRFRVDDEWPRAFVEKYGVPPVGASPVEAVPGRWDEGGVTVEYGPVTTRHDVLGPGTGWEHVFAVMRALGQRFGDDGVRLVVWFD
ncbi:hypothetical protein ACWIF8_15010 [Micromonospora chalcea]